MTCARVDCVVLCDVLCLGVVCVRVFACVCVFVCVCASSVGSRQEAGVQVSLFLISFGSTLFLALRCFWPYVVFGPTLFLL